MHATRRARPVAAVAAVRARQRGRSAEDAYDWATGGGEDYELLLTCDAGGRLRARRAGSASATGTALTVIGEVAAGEPDDHAGWEPRGEAVTVPGRLRALPWIAVRASSS